MYFHNLKRHGTVKEVLKGSTYIFAAGTDVRHFRSALVGTLGTPTSPIDNTLRNTNTDIENKPMQNINMPRRHPDA